MAYGWFARKFGIPELVAALDSLKEELVARLDPISDAAAAISLAVDDVATEVGKVAEQLADEPTEEQIAAAAESLNGIATRLGGVRDSVDALVERPGEDDGSTPPTEEPPPA